MTTENLTVNDSENNSTATVETDSGFKFETAEQALATYLDLRKGREALKQELADHEEVMSRVCREISALVGDKHFDLGDGAPRGSIVVKRERKGMEPLYFIRERNSGRPVGSKNRKRAEETPAIDAAMSADVSAPAPAAAEETVTAPETVESVDPGVVDLVALAQKAAQLEAAAHELGDAVRSHQSQTNLPAVGAAE